MKDLIAHWVIIRDEAADCATLRDVVQDNIEQELFAWLAEQLNILTLELERAIADNATAARLNKLLH